MKTGSHQQNAALRIFDANANRASEGLRVVEEYVRFALDDSFLTAYCKQLRHDLAGAVSLVPVAARLAARDCRRDVGAAITTEQERRRESLTHVWTANLQRVHQSLRCLEEYGKLLSPEAAGAVEKIRFRVYDLEQALGALRTGTERLHSARLYVLIDGADSFEKFDQQIGRLLAAPVDVVQLRDKRLDDRRLLQRARRLRELTSASSTLFIMNDRADLAAISKADGVHLGQDDLSVKEARQIVGVDALIGISTHSLEQAQQAVLDGANYIGVGPTFPSTTKQFTQFTGVELLRAVAREIRLPTFAIGGIALDRIAEVQAANFSRVAVGAAIWNAPDCGQAAREIRRALDDSQKQ